MREFKCESCGRPQPRAVLADLGEDGIERLFCMACVLGVKVPEVVEIEDSSGKALNARGELLPREREDDRRVFETRRQPCDTCRTVNRQRDLFEVHMLVDGVLLPVEVCRHCAERCVYVPDHEWTFFSSMSRLIRQRKALLAEERLQTLRRKNRSRRHGH